MSKDNCDKFFEKFYNTNVFDLCKIKDEIYIKKNVINLKSNSNYNTSSINYAFNDKNICCCFRKKSYQRRIFENFSRNNLH